MRILNGLMTVAATVAVILAVRARDWTIMGLVLLLVLLYGFHQGGRDNAS